MVKKPVTIHMPMKLRTALKHAATDRGATMSDFVVTAIEASLRVETSDARIRTERVTRPSPDVSGFASEILLSPILQALADQAASLREIRHLVELDRKGAGSETVTPQAVRVGAAARALMDMLASAGPNGVQINTLRSAMRGGSVSMAAMDAALAVLSECGIASRRGHRWVLVDH